jgi:hypothetical protein
MKLVLCLLVAAIVVAFAEWLRKRIEAKYFHESAEAHRRRMHE